MSARWTWNVASSVNDDTLSSASTYDDEEDESSYDTDEKHVTPHRRRDAPRDRRRDIFRSRRDNARGSRETSQDASYGGAWTAGDRLEAFSKTLRRDPVRDYVTPEQVRFERIAKFNSLYSRSFTW